MKYMQKYSTKKKFNELYPHTAMRGETNDETYLKYTPREIAKNYIKQAKATYDAIDMFCICEITDGNDYIIEGYHVTPELVSRLMKQYGADKVRVVFLTKKDEEAFVRDVAKSTTPNDWILKKTKKHTETLSKIAKMVRVYSEWFEKEARKNGLMVVDTGHLFVEVLNKCILCFRR